MYWLTQTINDTYAWAVYLEIIHTKQLKKHGRILRSNMRETCQKISSFVVDSCRDLDEGMAEAVSSLIWAAPRLQTDVAELKVIADQLTLKFGKPYGQVGVKEGPCSWGE